MRRTLIVIALCLLSGSALGGLMALVVDDGQGDGRGADPPVSPVALFEGDDSPDVRAIASAEAGSFSRRFDEILARELGSDAERWYLIDLLLARWIDLDPGEAGAKIVAENYLARGFFSAWGLRDMDAALAAAQMYDTDGRRRWAVGEALRGIATKDPQRFLKLVANLPDEVVPRELLGDAFEALAARDPAGAMAMAEEWGADAVTGAATGWARRDPIAALAWVEDGHPEYLSAVLDEWASTSPLQAIDHLSKQANPMADRDLAGRVLEKLAASGSPEVALKWVQENSATHGAYLAGKVLEASEGEPEELWRMVRENLHGHPQYEVLKHLGKIWSRENYETFLAKAEGFAGEERSAAIGMMNAWGRTRLHEAIEYAEQIADPDRKRAFVGAALSGGFGLEAMRMAIEFAPDFREQIGAGPEYSDEEVANALMEGELRDPTLSARATANRFWLVAPDEGARWLISHPQADTISWQAQNLTKIWSDTDPKAASSWLASLEPSLGRDYAALGLVEAIEPFDPAAAFEWASTIDSGEPRRSALDRSFRALLWSDRAGAEQALAESGLSEGEKLRLLNLEVGQ